MPLSAPAPVPVRHDSFLGAYASRGAFTDCYATSVPFATPLPAFIEAFYTTRLFKLERWLLARFLGLASSDDGAHRLAVGAAARFSAWKVEARSAHEILLDAGQTRSWLAVAAAEGSQRGTTTLLFGSAVVPRKPGGGFGLAFRALLGFHRLYSKLLLAAAVRNLPRVLARGGR